MISTVRVLLVEDEALIAMFTAGALRKAGYEVVGPADRLEPALELAAKELLNAAVLDVNVAGVAIWPVANVLHSRGVPFIFVSGFGKNLATPSFCQNVPFLSKPVKVPVLLNALAERLAEVAG